MPKMSSLCFRLFLPHRSFLFLLLLLQLLLAAFPPTAEAALTFVRTDPPFATPGRTVKLIWRLVDHNLTSPRSLSGGSSGVRFVADTSVSDLLFSTATSESPGWYCPCTGFGPWPSWPPCQVNVAGQECWFRTTTSQKNIPDAILRSTFKVPPGRFEQEVSVTGQLWLFTAHYDPEFLDVTATGSFTTGSPIISIAPSIAVIGEEKSLVPGKEFVFQFRLSNSGPSNARDARCRVRMAVDGGSADWVQQPEGVACEAKASLRWVCRFASDISPSSSANVQWRMTPPADFRGTLSITVDQCSAMGSQSPPTASQSFPAAPSWSLTSSFSDTEQGVMTMTEPFSFTSTLSNSGPSASLSTTCTWSFSTAALHFDGSNADAGVCEASSSTSDNTFHVTCVRDVEGGGTVLHPNISISAKESLRGTPSFDVELSCADEAGGMLPKLQNSLMVLEELESVDVDVLVVNAKLLLDKKRQSVYTEDNLGMTKQGQFVFDDALLFRLDFSSAGAHYARNITCSVELSGSDSVLMTFVPLSLYSNGTASPSCQDFGYQPSSNSRFLECSFADLQNVASQREMVATVDDRLREVGMTVNCSSSFLNSISNPVWKQALRFIHVDAVEDEDLIPPSSSSDEHGGNKNETEESNDQNRMALPIGLALGLGLPLLLLLLALLVLFFVLQRKKQRRLQQRHDEMTSSKTYGEQASMELYVTGDELAVVKQKARKQKREKEKAEGSKNGEGRMQWEIPFSELEFDEQIGQGCFGTVWKGTWRETTVAIKMFNSIMDSETSKANFKAESDIMKNLRPHTNVIQLFGVSMEEGTPWCLVTEFLAAGNLLCFLQNLKPNELDEEEFKRMAVRMAREIATGMHHLHSENIVHRDLAARNVLLTRDHSIKVSDFGLSTLESDEEKAHAIPVRWTPPEYFAKRIFDKKSDVWSYGVLLWEIVNFGQTPYSNLTSENVVDAILAGKVLEMNENVPEVLRTIAAQCFQFDPKQRPSFKDIILMLKEDNYSTC
ncbi:Tyrosine-protein kinase abl1 [Balamuthia mandrillaris]